MKAQFYSLISLLLAVPMLLFTVNYLGYTEQIGEVVSDRVISDQINQLVHSIEVDTTKAMEISGRRALLAATNHVINSGEFLDDSVENLTMLMLQGRINGSEAFLMLNNTMPNWSERISSKPVDFEVALSYGNISIENLDGFSIRVGMDLSITVNDIMKESKIEKSGVRKYVTISLAGLEDPIFPLETQGFIRRMVVPADPGYVGMNVVTGSQNSSGTCSGDVTFNKSEDDDTKILVAENLSSVTYGYHLGIILEDEANLSGDVSCWVTGNGSAVSLVTSAIESGYETIYIDQGTKSAWSLPVSENLAERYYYEAEGPTFLQRMEGNYTPSPNGIVTFIYVPELLEQAFPVSSYSRAAYRYFSDDGECYKVENTEGWFGMDSSDAAKFNITDLLTASPCDDS